jgi:hypothetical protein
VDGVEGDSPDMDPAGDPGLFVLLFTGVDKPVIARMGCVLPGQCVEVLAGTFVE